MPPLRVVPRLDVSEDRVPSFLSCMPIILQQQLELECGEETLGHRIIITIALATHARQHFVRDQLGPVLKRRVLTPSVGMMNQPSRWMPALARHAQRAQRQLDLHRVPHCPAHTSPRSEIEHGGELQPALSRRDIRHVRYPNAIDTNSVHVELARQQIRRDRILVVGIRRRDARPLQRPGDQPLLPHEPRNTL
jgi:hypothetical protein